MEQVIINDKEIVVMNLVHYFVTEKNYNPVVVHGINDEIWLENMDSEYKLVRIVSRYIHNNEQLDFNRFRSNQIVKKLKMKTLSFKMKTLSIYTDLGDNVSDIDNNKENNCEVFVKNIKDIGDNPLILKVFPDIIEKTHHDEKGLELLFKITDDINGTNERKNKKMEKIFSTKKPIITWILIGLCVIMFFISGMGYDTYKLVQFGANFSGLVRNGEIYRLVSYMFLHAGI
ncbi:MAG: rhomboid family intramembrane serine protease, partial [Bacilli bacterium]